MHAKINSEKKNTCMHAKIILTTKSSTIDKIQEAPAHLLQENTSMPKLM